MMPKMPALSARGSVGQASIRCCRSGSIWGDSRTGFSAGAVSPMGRFCKSLCFLVLALGSLQPSKLNVEGSSPFARFDESSRFAVQHCVSSTGCASTVASAASPPAVHSPPATRNVIDAQKLSQSATARSPVDASTSTVAPGRLMALIVCVRTNHKPGWLSLIRATPSSSAITF